MNQKARWYSSETPGCRPSS